MNIKSDVTSLLSQLENSPTLRKKVPAGDGRTRILVLTGNPFKRREFEHALGTGYGASVTFADDPVEQITDEVVKRLLLEASFSPHYVIREKSRLYDALHRTKLDGLKVVEEPESAPQLIHNVSKLRVWKPIWNRDSTLSHIESDKFFHQIKGSIDPSRKVLRDEEVFGWDHLFVDACNGLTSTDQLSRGYEKISPRQMVISDFVTRYLFYKTPQTLTHHSTLHPTQAVEFTPAMSVSAFINYHPLLDNPHLSIWSLDKIRDRILDEGVFFKAATSRPIKNYFTPPFGGIPLTPKKDEVEETIFMMHDLNHHNIPDLIYDGGDSIEIRNVYMVWRMMSEAVTLVIADMLYAHTLVLTNPENKDKADSRIYPLFEALDIEEPSEENRNEIIKKLLWANTQYALLGDDTEWLKLLKPGHSDKLTTYKNHFEKFFVGDHAWTAENYKNMVKRKEIYNSWVNELGKDYFRSSNLFLLSDMVEKIRERGANLFSIRDVVRYVFDEIIETRILAIAEETPEVSDEEKLSRAFKRYMTGQMTFYSYYADHEGIRERGMVLQEQLKATHFFDAAKRTELRTLFQNDVRCLWGRGVITTEAADNHLQLHPIFPPVYINYGRQECKSVKAQLEKLYGGADPLYVNTSNPGKLAEYEEYFFPRAIISQSRDLPEPVADPLTVIQYKASQVTEGVLLDDVALDIEDADVGINIRWALADLPKYIGRKCKYTCCAAVRSGDSIKIFESHIEGRIVEPRGDCFGFGRYFLPDGTTLTLGEKMEPSLNARYLSIQKFKEDKPTSILPLLTTWEGEFQTES